MNLNDNKNEFEIMDNGSMAYQARYPLAQAPGSELQERGYKEWMNRCTDGEVGELFADPNAVRDAVIVGVKVVGTIIGTAFPPLKIPALILSSLFPFLWPKQAGPPGTPEAQFTWEQMMSATEKMMDEKIDTLVKERAIESFQVLQSRMMDYQQAVCTLQTDPDNEKYKEDVRREFNDAEDQAKATIIQLRNEKYAGLLLADYAQTANLHLLLLQDVVQYGESWGFSFVEVQKYYSNTSLVGNPGMKQLLATYTDHCVRWYNAGLQNRYETNNWNTFNDYRRNMTLMVMDIVAAWPTYDPILYKVSTKSQLTRTLNTTFMRGSRIFPTISDIENNVVVPPSLFKWLRQINFYVKGPISDVAATQELTGLEQYYQYTLSDLLYDDAKGPLVREIGSLTVPNEDDVWLADMVATMSHDESVPPTFYKILYLTFHLTQTADQKITFMPNFHSSEVKFGFPCGPNNTNACDPCDPCTNETPNLTDPCDDKSLYSHRLSYMGTYPARYPDYPTGLDTDNVSFSYSWTHVSANKNNLIDTKMITQIPAVKGYKMEGPAKVIKGPGSTGGDLVQLDPEGGNIAIRVTGPVQPGYQLRIRYASTGTARLNVNRAVLTADGEWNDYELVEYFQPTYLAGSLNFDSFGYTTMSRPLQPGFTEGDWIIKLINSGSESIIIDKLEFIPIEGSVEEYEANLAVEKARKAVNALFTNDAKNALQLNVTDYAVDQAANLAECVSDE
ncbi:insecticidal delta-endotoxin Cry8Ea1 family protein, partial [Bacillus mycoides]|uniref:insecticidal delta-endotoxin Cry8Ea1 family protein n=1 Tax=Bacillus mycoides TaxID=1405 RepID=UPI003D65DEDE